jgi:hypothetical protein
MVYGVAHWGGCGVANLGLASLIGVLRSSLGNGVDHWGCSVAHWGGELLIGVWHSSLWGVASLIGVWRSSLWGVA